MIEQWKRLAAEKRRIECGMQACMKTLVGKNIRFKFGNMTQPADAEVLYVQQDGERINVRNVQTGRTRRISPNCILPNAQISGGIPYAESDCSTGGQHDND